jgi:hypothetical protein
MRTPSREAGCTHSSDQHLLCAATLRVVIDSKGRVNLDSDTTTYLLRSGIDAVRLLWNAEQRTMVFSPVKLTSEFSYAIVRDKKSQQATFSAQRFFRRVGCRTEQAVMLPLKWRERERLLEVALPPELLSRSSAQPMREEARRQSEPSTPKTLAVAAGAAGMCRFLPPTTSC